jgi:hypothetical protein
MGRSIGFFRRVAAAREDHIVFDRGALAQTKGFHRLAMLGHLGEMPTAMVWRAGRRWWLNPSISCDSTIQQR